MSAALAIQRLKRERGWSRTAIAREFLKRYRFGPNETKRDARSFAEEIRRLEDGNATWFANRPEAARLIAEILECSQAELGITTEDAQVRWADFPEMRALDLAKDDPFDISNWASVLTASNTGVWVVAGPGSGKTLFSQWAESRGLVTRVAASTLASAESEIVQALQRTPARPVLVDLADAHGALDVSERLAKFRVLVLASDPPPTNRDETAWSLFAPELLARDRFVDWVANRLDEGPEVSSRFRRELSKVDPSGLLISTPDAVIQFLGAIYEKREVDTVEALALRAGSRAKSKWLRANGAALFRELIRRRWLDVRYPYGASVSRSVWEGYIPDDLVAPKDTTELRQIIARFKKERSLDVDAVAAQLTLDARSIVALLVEAGLLRSLDDQMELRPAWLAHLETLAVVKSALSSTPFDTCATCVDPTRRSVIYGVLVALKPRAWQEFVHAALEGRGHPELGHPELGRVGAVECAFAAAALRHERGLPVGDAALLARLWRAQHELLEPRYSSGVREPLTRPGASSGFLGGGAFVADCWSWSLMIPKPANVTPEPWEFPGWEASLQPIPPWMNGLDRDADAVTRLIGILPKFLARTEPRELSSLPLWMWPSVLTAREEWRFQPSELQFLTVDREAASIADALGRVADEQVALVLKRIWTAILQWEPWAALAVLRGPLADRLLATFDPSNAAAALQNWARTVSHDLSLVPERLRGHVLMCALQQGLHLDFDVARYLGGEDEEVLVRLCNGPTAWTSIERVWQLVPDRAHRELMQRLSVADNDGDGWLEGPASVIERILESVTSMRPPYSEGVRRWAARRMIQHPWLADRFLSLLRPGPTSEALKSKGNRRATAQFPHKG